MSLYLVRLKTNIDPDEKIKISGSSIKKREYYQPMSLLQVPSTSI